MAMDLSAVTQAEMLIERLTQPDNVSIDFIQIDPETGNRVTLLSLTKSSGHHWDLTEVNNIYVNVEFLRLRVKDFAGFSDTLAATEFLRYQGFDYRIRRQTPPFGTDRNWLFRLERTSDFERD